MKKMKLPMILMFLLFAACAPAESSVESGLSEVRGGGAYSGLDSIGSFTEGGVFSCSGVLVAEKTVLTSARCAGTLGGNAKFGIGPDAFAPRSTHKIDRIILHPSYAGQVAQNDIAVVLLESAPSTVPMRLTTEDGGSLGGQGAYLVAYGQDDSWQLGAKKAAAVDVDLHDATRLLVRGPGNACAGDEGGALLRIHPSTGNVELAGIIAGASRDCEDFSVAMRIDAYASLLHQIPQDATQTGGVNTSAANDKDVLVVGFGDSVTDGYCASSGRDYVSLLVDNDDSYYPNFSGSDLSSNFRSVSLRNDAISGSTSCDYSDSAIRQRIRAANFPQFDDTIVLITIGGNDLIHDYSCTAPRECSSYCSDYSDASVWASRYRERLIDIVRVFQDELPGNVHVFLANMYDPTDGVGDIHNAPIPLPEWRDGKAVLDLYNDTIAAVAVHTQSVLVDMHGAMLGHGIHYDDQSNPYYDSSNPNYWYCSNLEDPNDAGYHAIRKEFWSEIEEEFGL